MSRYWRTGNPVGGEFHLKCSNCSHTMGPLVRWPAKCPKCHAIKEKLTKIKK